MAAALGAFAILAGSQPAAASHLRDPFFAYGFGYDQQDADCQEIHNHVHCFGPRFRRFPTDRFWSDQESFTSCDEARNILRQSGWHKVRVVSCGSRNHVFSVRKAGKHYRIKISARSGGIRFVTPYSTN